MKSKEQPENKTSNRVFAVVLRDSGWIDCLDSLPDYSDDSNEIIVCTADDDVFTCFYDMNVGFYLGRGNI